MSIAFEVTDIFDEQAVVALLAGKPAAGTALSAPYWKDYDSYPGNRPTDWSRRFDVSRWIILAAFADGRRLGGAVIVCDDPLIALLRECRHGALLWDLRVAPAMRTRGVGSALLRAAEEAAAQRGARALRVETQQINVPACRFYARHGFRLEQARRGAYPDLPAETQLLWRKTLTVESIAPSG
ncbi:MAG: GNAT family N-acetyltransferase [Gemmatimonadaceae bacterium]